MEIDTEQSRWLRKRTWAEVNLDNLVHNLNVVKNIVVRGPAKGELLKRIKDIHVRKHTRTNK